MASIYKKSEAGYFYAQVLNGDGTPANGATVTLTVYKDDNSKYVDAQAMTYITGSNGMYKYAFTAPATVGRMVADVSSTNPTAYGTEDIYVGQWTDDINSILAKTALIGASVALEAGGNLATAVADIAAVHVHVGTIDGHITADYGATEKTCVDLLDDASGGLADIHTDVGTVAGYVDKIDDATDGLTAIKAEVEGLGGAAMRGTDNAALASVCTEARLAELGATNIPADIDAIKAKTDLIGASVALESAGNLAAVKAKTDLIPADITTQLDNNVPAIKTKTDNLPSDPADESLLEAAIASAGTAPQVIRDAMKLAPSVGDPVAGSIDKHLDDLVSGTEPPPKESFVV